MSVCAVSSCGFRGSRTCKVLHGAQNLTQGVTYVHGLPMDSEDAYLRHIWRSFCVKGAARKKKLLGTGVCSKHFCEGDKIKSNKGWHLSRSAIPCLHGPPGTSTAHRLKIREEVLRKRKHNQCQDPDFTKDLHGYSQRAEQFRKKVFATEENNSDEEDEPPLDLNSIVDLFKQELSTWLCQEDGQRVCFYRMWPPSLSGRIAPICPELIIIHKAHETLVWQKNGELLNPDMISPGDFDPERSFVKRKEMHILRFIHHLKGQQDRVECSKPISSKEVLNMALMLIKGVLADHSKELAKQGIVTKKLEFLSGQLGLALNDKLLMPTSLFRLGSTLRLISSQSYSHLRHEGLLTLPSISLLNSFGAVSNEARARVEAQLKGGENFLPKDLKEQDLHNREPLKVFSEDGDLLQRKRKFLGCSEDEFKARRRAIELGVRVALNYKSDALFGKQKSHNLERKRMQKAIGSQDNSSTPGPEVTSSSSSQPGATQPPLSRLVPVSFEEVQRAMSSKSSPSTSIPSPQPSTSGAHGAMYNT